MRPSTDDLKRSRFSAQKDVDPPVLVTITATEEVNVAVEGAEPNIERILHFKELEKPLILKPTNGELIKAIVGSKYYDDWIGCKIVLYVDPTISFAGKITGGIRARAPSKAYMAAQDTSAEDRTAQEVIDSIHEPAEEQPSPAPALRENPKKTYIGQDSSPKPGDDVPF